MSSDPVAGAIVGRRSTKFRVAPETALPPPGARVRVLIEELVDLGATDTFEDG